MKNFKQFTLLAATFAILPMTSSYTSSVEANSQTQIASSVLSTQQSFYQDSGDNEGRRRNRGFGRRDMSPEQIEQLKKRFKEGMERRKKQRNDELKKALSAPAEEFAIINSKIDKLENLKRQAQPVRTSRRGGRGGFDFRQMMQDMNPSDQTHSKKIKAASEKLSNVMKNESASEKQISDSLNALRSARVALKKEIDSAKEDLKSILSTKQEASLVLLNILD